MKRLRYYLEATNDLHEGKWFSLGSYRLQIDAEREMEKEMRHAAYETSIGYADLHQQFRIVRR